MIRLFILFSLLFNTVLFAEGDWRSKYKNLDGISCCGKADCDIVPRSRIKWAKGFWVVDGEVIPKVYEKPSEDKQFWYCPKFHCFFIPGGDV